MRALRLLLRGLLFTLRAAFIVMLVVVPVPVVALFARGDKSRKAAVPTLSVKP